MSANTIPTYVGVVRGVIVAFAFVSFIAEAATLELQFDSLPTEQGWQYQGSLPEESVASVDGTSLTIDTTNLGAVTAWFSMPDIVNPDLPFTLFVRARIVQSDNTLRWPLDFQARHGLEVWAADLGLETINLPSQATIPIDGTQFHDFLIDAIPGVRSDFYIDDVLVESTTPFVSNVNAYLVAFGDGNAVNPDANGLIEIESLIFVQSDLSTVGGSVNGISPRKAFCFNISKRKLVRFTPSGNSWDCESEGLEVAPGDWITTGATGTVD